MPPRGADEGGLRGGVERARLRPPQPGQVPRVAQGLRRGAPAQAGLSGRAPGTGGGLREPRETRRRPARAGAAAPARRRARPRAVRGYREGEVTEERRSEYSRDIRSDEEGYT